VVKERKGTGEGRREARAPASKSAAICVEEHDVKKGGRRERKGLCESEQHKGAERRMVKYMRCK
jgi:hypothetical protein